MNSSLPLTISGFSSPSSREFQGKVATNTFSLVPTESGNMALDIVLSSGSSSLKTSLTRPVLSEVKIVADVQNRNSIQVGQDVLVNLSIQRSDGSVVDTWDMPLTFGIKGGDAKLTQTKIVFDKGRATTHITTGTKSASAQLYIQDTNY